MASAAQALETGLRGLCPGRCRHCGRLMMIAKLRDRHGKTSVGWQCLLCDTVVALKTMRSQPAWQPVPVSSRAYPAPARLREPRQAL
jgi:hypothetical protein